MIDHDLQKILDNYYASGFPAYNTMTPVNLRLLFNKQAEVKRKSLPALKMHSVKNITIKGTGGNLNLRLYYPNTAHNSMAQMYFHGGGFVIRDNMDIYDHTCRMIALNTEAVVIAVDYRLAPEDAFPSAVEDCFEATRRVLDNAAELNINANKIGVWGESCGGNLATVIPILIAKKTNFSLQWSILISPMLDVNFNTKSYKKFSQGYILTKETMQWFWQHYLSSPEDVKNPLVIPKLQTEIDLLPLTMVVTNELDPLQSEGQEYADILDSYGLLYKYNCYEKLIHGFFDLYYSVSRAKKACDDIFFHARQIINRLTN